MPLDPISLAANLRTRWLPGQAGHPSSVNESAQRFADVVAMWFAAGAANGLPCATAVARKPGLASSTASATPCQNPDPGASGTPPSSRSTARQIRS